MLRFENFSKTYRGGKRAVDSLTLHVEPGDIYGFIGHNGAGKTTAIRSAVGVLDFTEGDIFINGVSVKADPMRCKQDLAYIPDNPDIYDYLTGIQYLTFIADIYGVSRTMRDERIKRYADAMSITGRLGELISSYSHGMKQKLCIVSALIHDPKLMVLDEPFVGLDPVASHTLKTIMKEMCGRGAAIFFSTHVLPVAESLCNKIAIIKEGKLVVSGPTAMVKGNTTLEDVFLELIEE
ncbi:MAG: ABC transporter ATP-binding protein [Candidatus Gastranaerophilaceae bacterium]|nr:ABC transporter ATP-binding protein [Christensenellales bacterium]